jgi:hypothetical protein
LTVALLQSFNQFSLQAGGSRWARKQAKSALEQDHISALISHFAPQKTTTLILALLSAAGQTALAELERQEKEAKGARQALEQEVREPQGQNRQANTRRNAAADQPEEATPAARCALSLESGGITSSQTSVTEVSP